MKTTKKIIQKITSLVLMLAILFTSSASLFIVSAQTVDNYTLADLKCPEYNFVRTIKQGDRGQDVKLIQKILNLDYRTRIASNGIGSKGFETELYGVATREAVKKFQALFIELIGVADGKINARTLVVLNSVCKGPYFTGGGGEVFDINKATTSKDTILPTVTISAPPTSFLGETYRLWIYASEPVKTPLLESFIIDGGATLSDIRKENPSTYRLTIKPEKITNHKISIQLEADSIVDLADNKMVNASNEVSTLVSRAPEGPDLTSPSVTLQSGTSGIFIEGATTNISVIFAASENMIGDIKVSDFILTGPFIIDSLRKLDEKTYTLSISTTAVAPSAGSIVFPAGIFKDTVGNKNTASGELLLNIIKKPTVATTPVNTPDPNTNYNYGGGGGDSGGGGGQNPLSSLMQLLPTVAALGLSSLLGGSLSSLTSSVGSTISGAAGKAFSGGAGTLPGKCMCPPNSTPPGVLFGQPTIGLAPLGGTAPAGRYLSTLNPSVGGKYIGFPLPTPPGVCGQYIIVSKRGITCVNPLSDSTGSPVVGTIPTPPAFMWTP